MRSTKIKKTSALVYGHVYTIWSYYQAKIKSPIFYDFRPGHVPLRVTIILHIISTILACTFMLVVSLTNMGRIIRSIIT